MKRTHVAILCAIAAVPLFLAAPRLAAAPQDQQFILQSVRHDPCTATLRMEVANLGAVSPPVFLGAYPLPLSLVTSSSNHLEVSLPPSVPAGSYRLTIVVGKAPHAYDEAWVVIGATACTR